MVNRTRVVIEALEENVQERISQLAIDLNNRLRDVTPVETRWAASNWIGNIGSAPVPIGEPATITERLALVPAAREIQNSGLSLLRSYLLASGNIYISNNVNYIQTLNDGSSQQAPAGFVQAAIRTTVNANIRRR